MADVFAGSLLDRLPSARALSAARYFEYAPRAPLPSLATLARIRKQAPSWPQIALVAPRSTWTTPRGAMRPGPELEAGIDWLTRVSDILSAFAIVLATGSELSTGERDSELLASFVERLRPTGRVLVVAPRGLWEPEHGIPFAERINAVYGFDALEHDAPEGNAIVYGRVRPMGARPRLTEGHLAQIAERLASADCERAYVSIESDNGVRDAKRLSKALAEYEGAPPDEEDEDEEDEDEEDGSEDEEDEEEDEED